MGGGEEVGGEAAEAELEGVKGCEVDFGGPFEGGVVWAGGKLGCVETGGEAGVLSSAGRRLGGHFWLCWGLECLAVRRSMMRVHS